MLDFPRKDHYNVDDFRQLVHLLRQKDGCPWDSVQTHHSIRNNFLEEAYEVCEALDNEDTDLLKEELGDMLMQVIFHASIEEDAGSFNLDDAADGACRKLIFRHPNLFGGQPGESWDALKQEEKGYTTGTDALNGVARSLPALWRAGKIQRRAAEHGFSWQDPGLALDKLSEEVLELKDAPEECREEELGDLLFAAVCVAQDSGIDPEAALNRACDKFIARFDRMERSAPDTLDKLSREQLLWLWNAAKALEQSEESAPRF